ncbi:MAG: xanthine dehydrogenase family protein molybdopterin-binding subunit [Planctomycetes bacterium]|nr:xanthine dehydrogenase family protein molybdopterin-binding subunit [Planctomycetota bacterium]
MIKTDVAPTLAGGPTLIPTDMPTTNRPMNMGQSMDDNTSRLDGVAKITGAAKYSSDMLLPNAVFARFVRCPFGAANLETVDDSAARKVPGVIDIEITPKACTYNGQPVGHVVAESPVAVNRALKALKLNWKKDSVKTSIRDTKQVGLLKGNAPDADVTIRAVYSTPVQTHSSLETHGGVVDHKGDKATVYASTQGTFSVRDGFGDALSLKGSDFEVVCEYVGGGFGSKLGGPGKELMLAAKLSQKLKRPAYVMCNRAEEHLDTGNRPSSVTSVWLSLKKDGSVVGGEVMTYGGVGVANGGGGCNVPSGRYTFANVNKSHEDVSFNAGGPRAFRAPGRPQGAFAEELMLDEAAAELGMDPLALKRKLAIDDVYREMLDQGAKLIGWGERKANGSQTSVMRTGFGVGIAGWGSASPGGNAEVVIHPDGSVESRTGTQDIGTGQRTTMGICTADAIGIPLSMVTVQIGRSSLPPGPGSGGSVTSPTTAPTMMNAATQARTKLFEVLARQGGDNAADFTVKDGVVLKRGEKFLSWKDACAKLPADGVMGSASTGDGGKGNSQGVQFVKVVVDCETGIIYPKHVIAIQSCGRVICRKTAESQIIGGVIQGLSYGMFENRILDRNVGAMVNPNLEWYKILGPCEMPHIEPVLWAHGQTGVKALGEPPTIPTAGALACAVFNAIGAPVRHLPLTPDKVLSALEGARS